MKYFTNYPDALAVKHIKAILNIGQRKAYELVKTPVFENEIRISGSKLYSKTRLVKC